MIYSMTLTHLIYITSDRTSSPSDIIEKIKSGRKENRKEEHLARIVVHRIKTHRGLPLFQTACSLVPRFCRLENQ
jgi:hypothetical protein